MELKVLEKGATDDMTVPSFVFDSGDLADLNEALDGNDRPGRAKVVID